MRFWKSKKGFLHTNKLVFSYSFGSLNGYIWKSLIFITQLEFFQLIGGVCIHYRIIRRAIRLYRWTRMTIECWHLCSFNLEYPWWSIWDIRPFYNRRLNPRYLNGNSHIYRSLSGLISCYGVHFKKNFIGKRFRKRIKGILSYLSNVCRMPKLSWITILTL